MKIQSNPSFPVRRILLVAAIILGVFHFTFAQGANQSETIAERIERYKTSLSLEKNPKKQFELLSEIIYEYTYHNYLPDSALHYLQLIQTITPLNARQQQEISMRYIDFYQLYNPSIAIQYIDSVKNTMIESDTIINLRDNIVLYHQLGNSYVAIGDIENAKASFQQSIEYAKTDTSRAIKNELGYNYAMIASLDGLDSAIAFTYVDSSIAAYQNSRYLGYAFGEKAGLYFKYKNYEQALYFANKEIAFNKQREHYFFYSKNLLVGSYFNLEEYRSTIKWAIDLMEENAYQSNEYHQHYLMLYYGWQAAKKINDTAAENLFAEALIPLFERVQNECNNNKQLTQDIKQRNEQQQREILEQKDLLITLGDEKRQRQKMISWTLSLGVLIILLLSAAIFNRLKLARKQKQMIELEKTKSDNLLLNILPREVADELKIRGQATPKLIETSTILFTDFVGFTEKSETLPPEALLHCINQYFSAFDSIMEKYGIEKIKTIGDSYMAAGGLTERNATHAKRTVLAALEICEFILDLNEKKKLSNQPYFEARIGLHTGPVVAGIVGAKKFAYDVWGDTVNIASRVESNGIAGKVNIGQSTFEIVKNDFHCEYRGALEVKGGRAIKMYFVEH